MQLEAEIARAELPPPKKTAAPPRPPAPCSAPAPATPAAPSSEAAGGNRLRNLRKKLKQIEELERSTVPLTDEQKDKVQRKAEVLAEIKALEAGSE